MKNEKEQGDVAFVDGEDFGGFGGKNEVSFRSIVMAFLHKISTLAAKEWRGGYWQNKPVISGDHTAMVEVYVPDSREEYSNAVDYLADLLFPHFDKEMTKSEQEINQKLEQAKKSLKEEYKEHERFTQIWRADKVELKRQLFRYLSSFLHRKGYFENASIEE